MANLDNLIGSHLSLISQHDVRYDGILFSINAQESSIVLQKVRCLGTEDRVTDPSKVVAVSSTITPFVTFPGNEIKDLYVHDAAATVEPTPAPAPAAAAAFSSPDSAANLPVPPQSRSSTSAPPKPGQPQRGGRGEKRAEGSNPASKPPGAPASSAGAAPAAATSAGTGEHLLNMRVKRTDDGSGSVGSAQGEFDFQAGLSNFNKDEVRATIAGSTQDVKKEPAYVKDDFFDSLSCDVLDRAEGRSTRLNNHEERMLNTDTFGAVAVQSNYRRGYRGGGGYRGGRGRGRGNYRGGSGRGRDGGRSSV